MLAAKRFYPRSLLGYLSILEGHVGDAIVVFNESRIIPLFEAWEPGLCPTYAPAVPSPNPVSVAPPRPLPAMPQHLAGTF